MRVTVFEICRVTDKQATFFVNVNKAQGFDIIEFNNKYYSYICNPGAWRSKTAEFRTGFDGQWIFEDGNVYRIN